MNIFAERGQGVYVFHMNISKGSREEICVKLLCVVCVARIVRGPSPSPSVGGEGWAGLEPHFYAHADFRLC